MGLPVRELVPLPLPRETRRKPHRRPAFFFAEPAIPGTQLAETRSGAEDDHLQEVRKHERVGASAGGSDDAGADLTELLDRVGAAAKEGDRTSVGDVLDHVGTRSFAPILLIAGLVMLAPVIGDIPGVPVLMGLIVILVAAQFLLRRDHVWLPRWILRRSIDHAKLEKAVGWLRRPARFADRWTKPRLKWAVRHSGAYALGVACIVVAAATPIMEFIPFSANLAGIAITAFALALIAQDGAIAIVAIAFSLGAVGLVVHQLLG